MKERPILFSGDMVRAILAGRKTQTRRTRGLEKISERPDDWAQAVMLSDGSFSFWYPGGAGVQEFAQRAYPNGGGIRCPYGVPGDRLWVRETWYPAVRVGFMLTPARTPSEIAQAREAHYKSDADNRAFELPKPLHWKPGIHMPRWASRITLEIVSVRVQRVQDISEDDARAEGIIPTVQSRPEYGGAICTHFGIPGDDWQHTEITAQKRFIVLWNSINAKRGLGWDINPWVWAIEFRRVQ